MNRNIAYMLVAISVLAGVAAAQTDKAHVDVPTIEARPADGCFPAGYREEVR